MSVFKITDGSVYMHVIVVTEEEVYDMEAVKEYFSECEHGIFAERVPDHTTLTVDFDGVKVKHNADIWDVIYHGFMPTVLSQSEY